MNASAFIIWFLFGLGIVMTVGVGFCVWLILKARAPKPPTGLDSAITAGEHLSLSELLPTDPKQRDDVLEQLRADVRDAAQGTQDGGTPA